MQLKAAFTQCSEWEFPRAVKKKWIKMAKKTVLLMLQDWPQEFIQVSLMD
jgi:hypothetical protein